MREMHFKLSIFCSIAFCSKNKPNANIPDKEGREKLSYKKPTPEIIEKMNKHWDDNEHTGIMYQLISERRINELMEYFAVNPVAPFMRSGDGRGPMFWAHEFKRTKLIEIFKKIGVDDQLADANGRRPGE